jgi:predicted ATPase/DNA-binding CsgD family transcriptional regulator
MTAIRPGPVSQREGEVLALLREHLPNAQIAGRLHISVRTVEHHVSSLLRKYGVADRRALATIAGRLPRTAGDAGPGPGVRGLPPAPRTGFVGRAHERDAVLGLLATTRLISLVGPGGVGKTRLAAVVAEAAAPAFPLGVTFVDLTPVRDGHVAPAVAAALDVPERPPQPLGLAIRDRLALGSSLLVLDNCEHLLDAVACFTDELLSACAGTTVLATGRERLGVPGERVVPISPLPLGSDAEALFVDRATAADPGFVADMPAVAEICARLDGMPLALELAAARCGSLGTAGLLAALDDTLRLLSGGRGANERHHSLRAVLGWSHELLDADERALFRRLAVFAGAFDLDAAVALTPDGSRSGVADVLGRLADKSLVVRHRSPGRWRLLDTVRAYAMDRLVAAGEEEEARGRHLGWAVTTATGLEERLDGRWHDAFDAVADDLRAALACGPPGPGVLPHRLARSLGHLTYARRLLSESVGLLEDAVRRAPTAGDAAADLRTTAQAVYAVGLAGRAFDLLLASADRAGAAGDRDARAIALADAVVTAHRFPSGFAGPVPRERLDRLLREAVAHGDPGCPVVAAHLAAAAAWHSPSPDLGLFETAAGAARSTGDPALIGMSLAGLGMVAELTDGLARAGHLARERLALLSRMDRHHPYAAAEILDAHHFAWLCALARGDLPDALSTARTIGDDDLLGAHPYRTAGKLIPPLALMGRHDEALEHAEPMWDEWRRSGAPIGVWLSFAASTVALSHGLLGDDGAFRLWRGRADQALGTRPRHAAFAAFVDARVAAHTGTGDVPAIVARAFADPPAGTGWQAAYARAAGAELAVIAGLPEAGERLAAAATTARGNAWATACCARAAARHDSAAPAIGPGLGRPYAVRDTDRRA